MRNTVPIHHQDQHDYPNHQEHEHQHSITQRELVADGSLGIDEDGDDNEERKRTVNNVFEKMLE